MTDRPKDLVAPFAYDDSPCAFCGSTTEFLVPLEVAMMSAAGVAPILTPCCARHVRIDDIGKIAFVSAADWNNPDIAEPVVYQLTSAMLFTPPNG